jgi:hypothetical protein
MVPLSPELAQMPVSSQLVGINRAGIATLANGTYWRIAPRDLARAKGWIPGTEITITAKDVENRAWPFTLTNMDAGESVAGVQSKPPPK